MLFLLLKRFYLILSILVVVDFQVWSLLPVQGLCREQHDQSEQHVRSEPGIPGSLHRHPHHPQLQSPEDCQQ
jgi:hypothetical protein